VSKKTQVAKDAEAKTWPASKVESRPVKELFPYANNARTHSSSQVDQICKSIEEFGFTNPILIDEESNLIAGHGRLLAARKLSITEVPVMVAIGWTQEQKQAYVLADNKLAMNSGWDSEMLAAEMMSLEGSGFDIGMLGFDSSELKDILYVPPDLVDGNVTIPVSHPDGGARVRVGPYNIDVTKPQIEAWQTMICGMHDDDPARIKAWIIERLKFDPT